VPFPEELKELLAQDELGNKFFHQLTPGKQRNIIFYVNQVKNADLRIQRAMIFITISKKNKGKIKFSEVFEELPRVRSEMKIFIPYLSFFFVPFFFVVSTGSAADPFSFPLAFAFFAFLAFFSLAFSAFAFAFAAFFGS
jgi:hypothetical protein